MGSEIKAKNIVVEIWQLMARFSVACVFVAAVTDEVKSPTVIYNDFLYCLAVAWPLFVCLDSLFPFFWFACCSLRFFFVSLFVTLFVLLLFVLFVTLFILLFFCCVIRYIFVLLFFCFVVRNIVCLFVCFLFRYSLYCLSCSLFLLFRCLLCYCLLRCSFASSAVRAARFLAFRPRELVARLIPSLSSISFVKDD